MHPPPADTGLYARMLEAAPDGMALTDSRAHEHPILHVNRAFEVLTGYAREQVIGRHLRFLLPGEEARKAIQELSGCLSADTSRRLTLPCVRADGGRFWSELTTVPLRDEGGHLTHRLHVLRDVGRYVGLREQVSALEREVELSTRELVKLATRDTLTTLYNRRYFLKRLEREWRRCLQERCSLVLFNLGLDGFKRFNEMLGNPAGDRCLQQVAHILKTSFPLDSDVVARSGSVEFIASSENLAETAALALAESIALRIREIPPHDAGGMSPVASIGLVCAVPTPELDPARFLRTLSSALARAKHQGGGPVCLRPSADKA